MSTTTGTAGNDAWWFTSAPSASFVLDGLGGTDTLSFGTSWRSGYTIVKASDGGVHVDSVSGASAALHGVLYNMEILSFNSNSDTLDLTSYFGVPNHLPTGAVTIAGTSTQGQSLTASNNLADIDGLGAISYQWQAAGVNISGATSNTLVLAEAQVGKAVSVVASYVDGNGTVESVTSSSTGAVVNVNDPPTGNVIIIGTEKVYSFSAGAHFDLRYLLAGYTSSALADTGIGFVELKNLTLAQNTANNTTLVKFDVDFDAAAIAGSKITGALIDMIYDFGKVSSAEVVSPVFAEPVYGRSINNWGALVSNLVGVTANGKIAAAVDLTTSVNPITESTGKAFGVTLTVNSLVSTFAIGLESYAAGGATAITTADGVSHKVDVGVTKTAGAALAAAGVLQIVTDTTVLGSIGDNELHMVTTFDSFADVTHLTVRYDINAAIGATVASSVIAMDFVGDVRANINPATLMIGSANSAGSVTINGAARPGQTLTAVNTLADADGMGTVGYQWKAGGININGATGNTYLLTAAQAGKTVTVAAGYTDGHGALESMLSAGLTAVQSDTTAPTLMSSSPADNAFAVGAGNNPMLTFSEPIQAAIGQTQAQHPIVLTNLANSADTRSISVADSTQVTFSGSIMTINPTADLLSGAHYAVSLASGAITDLAGNGFAGVSGNTALDFTVAGSAVQLHGIVYQWKSHVLLDGTSLLATSALGRLSWDPGQFKNLTWDAAGHASVDIYAHSVMAFQDFSLELELGASTGVVFTADAALPSDWSVLSNIDPANGHLLVAGFGMSNAIDVSLYPGDIKLGTVTFETGALDHATVQLLRCAVGDLASSFGLAMARDVTDVQGGFTLSELLPNSYAVTASRATADSGSAITSADALAALRIAVGLNPNPDPDGVGILTALPVSPYQFIAADVVGTDGRITSADALAILRMAVKLPTAPAKEWLFVEETRDFWDEATGKFTLDRTHASWDHAISANVQSDLALNLVGVLKGDVNGSWAAPAGSVDLDVISPQYFTALHDQLGLPVAQFGVYP